MLDSTTLPPPAAVMPGRAFAEPATRLIGAVAPVPGAARMARRGTARVVAVIPAWNEADCIGETIAGLRVQTARRT